MADEHFHPSNSLIAGLTRWHWTSTRSEGLSVELVKAVARAEDTASAAELEVPTRAVDAELKRRARAHWERAYSLAETLRRVEPAPHPTLVEEAIARADVAASHLGLELP